MCPGCNMLYQGQRRTELPVLHRRLYFIVVRLRAIVDRCSRLVRELGELESERGTVSEVTLKAALADYGDFDVSTSHSTPTCQPVERTGCTKRSRKRSSACFSRDLICYLWLPYAFSWI